jgi:hypothetical protein
MFDNNSFATTCSNIECSFTTIIDNRHIDSYAIGSDGSLLSVNIGHKSTIDVIDEFIVIDNEFYIELSAIASNSEPSG